MEKMIQIPEWQMKEIEDTLRMANNIHNSQKRETCFDRCVCKSWEFSKQALRGNEEKICVNEKCAIHPPVGTCFLSFRCSGYLSEHV